jgi:hypothetical protein
LDLPEADFYPIRVWTGYTTGQIEIGFENMKATPFNGEDARRMLLDRLNAVAGLDLPPDSISRYPNVPMNLLAEESTLAGFLGAIDWGFEQVRKSQSPEEEPR